MKNAGREVRVPTKGTILPYPDFCEEYFEWIDVLESVLAADQQFVMIELGAGYGRWLVQRGRNNDSFRHRAVSVRRSI